MPYRPSFKPPSRRSLAWLALTLSLAAAGGGAFAYIGMPAGWLSGALIATAIAALFGVPVGIGFHLRQVTFVMLGTGMGSAISPSTLYGMTSWPVTMIVLLLSVPVMMMAVVLYLERVAGWDRQSAFFAAAPGALSAVLAMAETTGADTRRVVFGQSIRVFVLVALLPAAMAGLGHQPSGTLPTNPVVPDMQSLFLSLAVGIAGGLAAEGLRFPGGAMVGAMLASGMVHGAGLIEGRLPDIVLILSFICLGANTGSRFAGTRMETLRRFVIDSLAALVIATTISVAFAAAGAWLSGEPLPKVLLAYIPGALEAMTIMSFVLGLDPAFVAAHHLARFLCLALLIPLVVRLMFGRAVVPSEHMPLDDDETKD